MLYAISVNGSPHMKNRKTTASLSSDGSGHNAATAAAVAAMGGKREKKGKIGTYTEDRIKIPQI